MEIDADLLLIDEKAGREFAMRQGLRVVGLLGVALQAHEKALLDCPMKVFLSELESHVGFRMSAQLRMQVLLLAGEI